MGICSLCSAAPQCCVAALATLKQRGMLWEPWACHCRLPPSRPSSPKTRWTMIEVVRLCPWSPSYQNRFGVGSGVGNAGDDVVFSTRLYDFTIHRASPIDGLGIKSNIVSIMSRKRSFTNSLHVDGTSLLHSVPRELWRLDEDSLCDLHLTRAPALPPRPAAKRPSGGIFSGSKRSCAC